MSAEHPKGRVPAPTRLPSIITTPMSRLYQIGINHRNKSFDSGKGVTRLDRPVISVGNLSTGGTGKSPMVHLIVRKLEDMGHRPVIAMRGYGAKSGEMGDEQLEHEEALPGTAIVAQPDRLSGLRELFTSSEGEDIDCVVLDDGFQHRKIARDLDIVLIDASRPPDRDALLPRGHLREGPASLARAGLVVLTHAERVDDHELERLRGVINAHNPDVGVISASHSWGGFVSHALTDKGWSDRQIPFEQVAGTKPRIVCAIGNADAFVAMARDAGFEPQEVITLRDHAPLSSGIIIELTRAENFARFEWILMTRKDWVKARTLACWPSLSRVIVPELSMDLNDPQGLLVGAIRTATYAINDAS